jgi:type I restriction enzyme S subunit
MVTWIEKPIGDLFEFKNGLNKGKEFFGHGTPIVNYMDVYKKDGVYGDELRGRVALSPQEIKRFEIRKGDVFFTRTSETPDEIGIACVLLDDVIDGVFSGFVLRGRPLTNELDIGYCKYCFQTVHVRNEIVSNCTYTTRALTNGTQLSKIHIPVPPLPEQRLIAAALSDADGYIAALEKLIAKKRLIKQGAMQELLTGKRRLPGFEGEWIPINLAKNSVLKARIGWQGLTTAEYRDEGYSYLITGTDFLNGRIDWSGCHWVDKFRFDQDPNIQVRNGDVLITKDGTIGKIALVSGLSKNATLNSGVFVIRPINDKCSHLFAYYILSSEIFTNFLSELSAGSTINHLYQKDFVTFEFLAPPTLAEQTAIAQILSDMDSEIAVLEKKLNKVRLIKQGMMQELLTGRIRLPEQETESAPETAAAPKIVELPKREPKVTTAQTDGHNQPFDDAVMIAGIVNVLYSDKFPLGRKKVQKCLYLLRRHQDESTAAFKKHAAGPYADEIRYKGGEPIARSAKYIKTTTTKGKGTAFARGASIDKALGYIRSWGRQSDIQWVADKLKFKKVEELELLATVDMATCDLTEAEIPISVDSIKHLIATNKEWKAKLKKQTFSDANIARAIKELQTLLQGGNQP